MSSLLYTTKIAATEYHPVPDALDYHDVLTILHDHSTLAHLFWPRLVTTITKEPQPGMTEWRVSSSDSRNKATMTSTATGVACEEEMPLGLWMTVKYSIVESGAETKNDDADSHHLLPGLYLEVGRSVSVPRPLSPLTSIKDDPITKTQNLLSFLDDLGRNGKDLEAASAGLQGSATDPDPDATDKSKTD
ncbi:hypothetical protein BJX61DRAFT_547288 [Aspergillus egyptiacus]|nr:hypothetical protein BJX61DRAFT_547288 [Aspergillus egyptiacus]